MKRSSTGKKRKNFFLENKVKLFFLFCLFLLGLAIAFKTSEKQQTMMATALLLPGLALSFIVWNKVIKMPFNTRTFGRFIREQDQDKINKQKQVKDNIENNLSKLNAQADHFVDWLDGKIPIDPTESFNHDSLKDESKKFCEFKAYFTEINKSISSYREVENSENEVIGSALNEIDNGKKSYDELLNSLEQIDWMSDFSTLNDRLTDTNSKKRIEILLAAKMFFENFDDKYKGILKIWVPFALTEDDE